jgi:hypothetical protein
MAKQIYEGNPSFPQEEPQRIIAASSTNDTDVIYCIDTQGVTATFGAGMVKEDGTTPSAWAGNTYKGVLYGRFKLVTADVDLACYRLIPSNSNS